MGLPTPFRRVSARTVTPGRAAQRAARAFPFSLCRLGSGLSPFDGRRAPWRGQPYSSLIAPFTFSDRYEMFDANG